MRHIICEECKRPYNYDKDEFCPRCGAYNQPVKTWGTDSQGNIVRVDGLNESNHAGSFAHKEVHREKAIRRSTGMDRRRPGANSRRAPSRPAMPPQMSPRAQRRAKYADSVILRLLPWFLGVLFFALVVIPWLFALL